jgi:protocatechuate 3,4-dioxygenase beta subunit
MCLRLTLLAVLALVGIIGCGPSVPPAAQQPTAPQAPVSTAAPTVPPPTSAPTSAPTTAAAATQPAGEGAAAKPGAGKTECSKAEPPLAATSRITLGPTNEVTQTTTAEAGERLIVSGTIYAADCAPLVGATLRVWQTDPAGEYGPGQGTGEERCCYLGGLLTTDERGRYEFETVRPGHYKGEQQPPPAHIHFEVSHPDARTLETELLFEGDPHIPAAMDKSLIVSFTQESDAAGQYLRGVFDVVLGGKE